MTRRRGPTLWEYYFRARSSYRGGNASLDGRPVRLLAVSDEDARRHAIWSDKDAVTSYFEFNRYDDQLHAVRTRVRRQGARAVNEWLRVRPPLLAEAAALLAPWRRQVVADLLGVHLRGTDEVTHPTCRPKFFSASTRTPRRTRTHWSSSAPTTSRTTRPSR